MALGRLLERSEIQGGQLDRIEARLMAGDRRFQAAERRLTRLERRSTDKMEVPRWERHMKRWLTYLAPLMALWATGSIDSAARLIEALR